MKDRPLLIATIVIALLAVLVTVGIAGGAKRSEDSSFPYRICPDAHGGVWMVDKLGNLSHHN